MQIVDNGQVETMQMTQKAGFGQMIENIGGTQMAVTDSLAGSSGSHDTSSTPAQLEDAKPPERSTKTEVSAFSFNGAPVKTERAVADEPKSAKAELGVSGGRNKKAQGRIDTAKKQPAAPKSAPSSTAGGGSGAGSAVKGRGRPKRDASTLLRSGLRELASADPSSKFFTNEWKNVERNWANYLIDLGKMMVEEDPAVLDDLQALKKQATVAVAVLNKFVKKGMSHADTLDTYKSQVHWLNMGPTIVESPFPPYLVKCIRSHALQDAWPAAAFWSQLADSALQKFLEQDELEEFQMTAFTTKVMLIVQEASVDAVVSKLECLVVTATIGESIASHNLKQEVVDLAVIVKHSKADSDGGSCEFENLSRVLDLHCQEVLGGHDCLPKGPTDFGRGEEPALQNADCQFAREDPSGSLGQGSSQTG